MYAIYPGSLTSGLAHPHTTPATHLPRLAGTQLDSTLCPTSVPLSPLDIRFLFTPLLKSCLARPADVDAAIGMDVEDFALKNQKEIRTSIASE